MSLLNDMDEQEPEPVNVLDYFEAFGLSRQEAFSIVLHLLLTRTHVYPSEAREAAAELGIHIPFVHPGDGRMH
jgi:hypothetical protein